MSQSWSKSRESTLRLWDFVTTLKPHATSVDVILSRIRTDTLLLAEPLRLLMSQLELCIRKMKKAEKSLKEDPTAEHYVKIWKLEPYVMDHAKTVCVNPRCMVERQIKSEDSESEPWYTIICHSDCNLHIPTNQVNTRDLKYCSVMNYSGCLRWLHERLWIPASYIPLINGSCTNCSNENGVTCRWYNHKHVAINYNKVPQRIELIENKQLIRPFQDRNDIALRNLHTILLEHESELEILGNAMDEFALYVGANFSLTAFVYCALEFFKVPILSAIEKFGRLVDYEKSEASLIGYNNLETQATRLKLGPASVQSTLTELFNPKYSGTTLKLALEASMSIGNQQHAREITIYSASKNQIRRSASR